MMTSLRKSWYIKKVFFAVLKFLSYLVCVPSIKSINSSSLFRKKYGGGNFSSTPHQGLRDKLYVGGYYWLTESFAILNYKPVFKHCILQTVWSKKPFVKNWVAFYIFWFGMAFGITVLEVLCFWCFLDNFIRN